MPFGFPLVLKESSGVKRTDLINFLEQNKIGTGFIGKWLLATFLHANRRLNLSAKVVVLSRRPEAFLNEFPELRDAPEVTWLTGDVRDFELEAAYGCS